MKHGCSPYIYSRIRVGGVLFLFYSLLWNGLAGSEVVINGENSERKVNYKFYTMFNVEFEFWYTIFFMILFSFANYNFCEC